MSDPDPESLIWQIVIQLLLILLNAVFACSEIAVISINDKKLERMSSGGNKRAKRLLSLTAQPAKFLATIQIGITLAGFLGSAFAADNFAGRLTTQLVSMGVGIPQGILNTVSLILITIILSYVTLVLGELVPKRIAMQKAESIGLAMSGFVYVVAKIFTPIVWFLTISTDLILKLLRIDPNANESQVTEEEIRIMVDAGSEKGVIDAEEQEFVHNVFDFGDVTAYEIMTHRTDVVKLWLEDSDAEWEKTIFENKHSMYPVCDDSADNIVGVLNTKDYFRLADKSRESVMSGAVKPPKFVPETAPADVMLRDMKKNRNHFAIVLDEHGGVSGVLTINDLLEQLVGDIDDDSEAEACKPQIHLLECGAWEIQGSAPLENVADAIKRELPCDEYDSFAGLVFNLLGGIPKDGETPETEGYGLSIKIAEIKDHRINSAIVRVIETEEPVK